MSSPRHHRIVFWVALAGLWISPSAASADTARAAEDAFRRPEAPALREHVRDILDDAEFKPRRSLWEYLWTRLAKWLFPKLGGGTLGTVLGWIFRIGAILGLLLVLALLVRVLIQGASWHRRRGRAPTVATEAHAQQRWEDLDRLMRLLAEQRRFREAIAAMTGLLIRWLDEAKIVRFQESKTNGDYVREYPPARAEGEAFGRFVRNADIAVYGGQRCDGGTYQAMTAQLETVRDHVGRQP